MIKLPPSFAGRNISTHLANLKTPTRLALLALLLLLTSLAPIEFFTGWCFSSASVANAAYPISFVTYLLLTFALWSNIFRVRVRHLAEGAGLLLSVLLVAALFFGRTALLEVLIALQPQPIRSGQLTPTLSYQLNPDSHLFGRSWLELRIYRSPAWLPLIHKEVANSLLDGMHVACIPDTRPYTDAYDPDSVTFAPGPDDYTVLVTCTHSPKASQPASSSTATIVLR